MRRILIRRDADELGSAAAELFVQIARTSIAERRSFSVALAGGSTPKMLYNQLASSGFRGLIEWQQVKFFLGDERNVAPDSPDSNFRMVSETLLKPLAIADDRVFRWRTELGDVDETGTEYESSLEANGPLDLVILGLGADGHTASLFPHSPALKEPEKFAVANWVDKLGDYRFTMTFPAINESKHVIFLVSGEDKARAVADVLEGEYRPDELPAQSVNPRLGTVYWLLDKAAASSLKR